MITAILSTYLTDTTRITTAADGWAGDRAVLYSQGGQHRARWISSWVSEKDAKEFADLYGEVLVKRYPEDKEIAKNLQLDGKVVRIDLPIRASS